MRSPFIALVRKDLKGYFDQPTGYVLVVIFVALLSYAFFRSVDITGEASLRELFTVTFTVERPSLPWLLVLFVPAATMRLLAEEQRDGTLEILLTQPIRGWVVLIAKFLAGFLFVGVAIVATIGIPIALSTAGNLDEGAIIGQYVGSLLLAASFVSIGLFTSSLTQNQIVALIIGFTLTAVLMVVGLDPVIGTLPTRVSGLLQTLSPITHFSTIARGVIDLRDVLYFVALVSTFLSAAFLMMRSKILSHRTSQYPQPAARRRRAHRSQPARRVVRQLYRRAARPHRGQAVHAQRRDRGGPGQPERHTHRHALPDKGPSASHQARNPGHQRLPGRSGGQLGRTREAREEVPARRG